jgi:DNA modification methylase
MELGIKEQVELLSEEAILRRLLATDLDFEGAKGNYASHNFHAFAAKFPPQLPRLFIENLTQKGDIVLDPMMGSGTSIVEGMLTGRSAIGFDIDPLAVSITKIKTTPISKVEIEKGYLELKDNLNHIYRDSPIIEETLESRFDPDTKKFIDYWFLKITQKEIMTLVLAIEDVTGENLKNFFKLIFSSIIITKSGGISMARDLAHSRPHLDKSKIPKNAYEMFEARIYKILQNYPNFTDDFYPPRVEQCDSRIIPLNSNSVHLIVTSPPYANAIDYMRAHKFSLVWFGENIKDLAELRSRYIGSERVGIIENNDFPDITIKTLEEISEKDLSKSRVLTKYFQDMKLIFLEMHRVLIPNKCAVMVVGSSTMRGIDTCTQSNLSEIAKSIGFKLIKISKRTLDRNKRMMPARFGQKKSSQIEHRMYEEFVIGLQKPV